MSHDLLNKQIEAVELILNFEAPFLSVFTAKFGEFVPKFD
jgi:hypothetical protein